MQQILFLRDFLAGRVIKGRFTLRTRSPAPEQTTGQAAGDGQGMEERPEERFAFDHRPSRFARGEIARVRRVMRRDAETLLVLSDNPILGEVVLDGALEGRDYEVIA